MKEDKRGEVAMTFRAAGSQFGVITCDWSRTHAHQHDVHVDADAHCQAATWKEEKHHSKEKIAPKRCKMTDFHEKAICLVFKKKCHLSYLT